MNHDVYRHDTPSPLMACGRHSRFKSKRNQRIYKRRGAGGRAGMIGAAKMVIKRETVKGVVTREKRKEEEKRRRGKGYFRVGVGQVGELG